VQKKGKSSGTWTFSVESLQKKIVLATARIQRCNRYLLEYIFSHWKCLFPSQFSIIQRKIPK
jgi:hypothetical protein